MDVTYNKLFKMLIDKEWNKTEFAKEVGISTNTLAKLSRNEFVSMEILVRICRKLNCTVDDIIEILPETRERVSEGHRMDNIYPYIASLTREPFLFYEMRTTAKLLSAGLSEEDVIAQITKDNLFQYPTEKSVARMAKACLKRLSAMNDTDLIEAIASQPNEIAKQICLYAMMKQSRLVWEFMLTVIGRSTD